MKSFVTLATLLLSSSVLMAQGTQSKLEPEVESKEGYTAVFATVGIPSGDFAKETADNLGKAKIGFGLGISRVNQINPQLSSVFEARFNYNSLDISEAEGELSGSGVSIDESGYKTIWGLGGIQINSLMNSGGRIYVKGLGGVVFGLSPQVELSGDGESLVVFKGSTALSFGFGFGGGFTIKDKFLLELMYLHAKPEYTITSDVFDESVKTKMDHSILSISFGFLL